MSNPRLSRVAALVVGCIYAGIATPGSAQEAKWGPHVDLTGQLGKRDKGEVDLFAPLMQDDRSLLFLDGRGKLFNEGVKEGNVGLGYRRMMDGGWNLGGYGFFDLRRSENDNTFSQVTVGAEALSLDWDLRVNGYLPLRERAGVSSSVTGELSGGGIVVRHRRSDELAFRGFDAEVGWRAPVFAPAADRQLRLFAGGYYFDHGDADEVAGPRGRVEYRMHDLGFLGAGSRLTL
ncbi:MAG: inverse autotransporter beta domain-containing protein, partial [Alphaproteobacteria bacterium]